MKNLWIGLVSAALIAGAGCQGKSTSGGPGATKQDEKKVPVGQAEASFSLSPPALATKLKQGEAKQVTVGIKRGTNFDQDVQLKFEGLPKGVTIEPPTPTIKHGDDGAKVTVKAADDAAVGDFTVKAAGHPEQGRDAVHEMKIAVKKK
jgi:hypothetical protein